ncbi:hypothetical protein [Pseudoalteromonas sp.]|uniref:hypothetical protein n=1 Tax=Pseudoalteromonas sp. TaxID=53249 RepID=UPI00272C6412|nr:hypothetical protein [Pseudoalteromonas sp.]
MEKLEQLFSAFIYWHETNFIVSVGGDSVFTLGRFIALGCALIYVLIAIYNTIYRHRVDNSLMITSLVIAISYVFSSIGFYAIYDLIISKVANSNDVMLMYGWVGFDSACVILVVWLHVGTSNPMCRSSKITLSMLMLNSAYYLWTQHIFNIEGSWVPANSYYPDKLRPHIGLVIYTYWDWFSSVVMMFSMGGYGALKHFWEKLNA